MKDISLTCLAPSVKGVVHERKIGILLKALIQTGMHAQVQIIHKTLYMVSSIQHSDKLSKSSVKTGSRNQRCWPPNKRGHRFSNGERKDQHGDLFQTELSVFASC